MGVGVAPLDASRASAEGGGGRRVAAGAGHAPLVLLAGGGGRLAEPEGWAEPGGWASTGKARVGFPLSLSLFICFCFSN